MQSNCVVCFESLYYQSSMQRYFFGSYDCICDSCRYKMTLVKDVLKLEGKKVRILYLYDHYLEGLLFQYKECKDIALASLFLCMQSKEINDKFRGYTLVYMPSNESKTKDRGFHTLELMSKQINLKKVQLFEKNKNYKQSSQSFENRRKVKDVIRLNPHVKMPQGKLLLFDDVGTSGATLKAALHLLKDYPGDIEILLFSATQGFVESCDLIVFSKLKKFHILNLQLGGAHHGR